MVPLWWTLLVTGLVVGAVGQSSRPPIAIGSFLSVDAGQNERYYYHGYRMAFVEHFEQVQFTDMPIAQAKQLINKYVEIDNATLTRMKATMSNGREVVFQVWKVPGSAMESGTVASTMNQLLNDPSLSGTIKMVLGGHSSSKERLRATWATQNGGLPFISGGGASSDIFLGRSNCFGLLSPVEELANSTMKVLAKNLALPNSKTGTNVYNIALLYEDVAHGYSYRNIVEKWAARELFLPGYDVQFNIVFTKPFPLESYNKANFSALFDELEEAVGLGMGSADLLLIDAHSQDFRLMQTVLSERQNVRFKAITYGARGTDLQDIALLSKISSDMERSLNGVFAGLWWSPGINTTKSRAFVDGWRKHEAQLWVQELEGITLTPQTRDRFVFAETSEQLPPTWFGALGFEAMNVALDAIEKAKAQDAGSTTAALLTNIQNTNLASIVPGGVLKFDTNGQAYNEYTVAQNLNSAAGGLKPLIVYPATDSTQEFREYPAYDATLPRCNSSFFRLSIQSCNEQNVRPISMWWIDADGVKCPDPTQPCACQGMDLEQFKEIPCSYIYEGSGVYIGAQVMSYLGMAIVGCFILLLLFSWRNEMLKGAQKPILLLIGLSSLWAVVSILSLIGENTEAKCKSRFINVSLSFGLTVSLIFGRVWYWYKLWSYPTQKNFKASASRLAIPVILAFVPCLILISVWAGILDSFSVTSTFVYRTTTYESTSCTFFDVSPVLIAITGAYFIVLLCVCGLLAFQSKDCDGRYFESWYLWVALFNLLFIAFLLAILLGLLQLEGEQTILFIAIALFVTGICCTICSYFPRLSAAFGVMCFKKNKNPSMGSDPTSQTSQTNNVRKYIHGRKKRVTTRTSQ